MVGAGAAIISLATTFNRLPPHDVTARSLELVFFKIFDPGVQQRGVRDYAQ